MPLCPLCNNPNTFIKIHKNIKDLWFCPSCVLLFVWPQPLDEELKNIYNVDYFKNRGLSNIGYENYQEDKEKIQKTFEKRLKTIEKFIDKPGKVLDLGCAIGFFLEVLTKRGWDVYGLDISEFAVSVAREKFGKRVINNFFENSNFPKNYFDLITMWDYLEHVKDPKKVIEICRKILKPNGLLVLTTPDFSSLVAKITGEKWLGYKNKEHLFCFSREALKNLLSRYGFTILKMQYVGKYVSLDLIIKRASHYFPLFSLLISKLIKIFHLKEFSEKSSIYVNPFDIILIIAKKQS